jgi:putative spermidine/putrescine transport system ATP-binding protein
MSAENDAATKSPSKGFSLKSRFLGRGAAKVVPAKDEKSEDETKAEAGPGPGSSLLAAMIGDEPDEASVTINKASADEAAVEDAPEAEVSEPAPVEEPPAAEVPPEPIKPPTPPKTFSFRSKFLGLAGPSRTSLPKPETPEPPEDEATAEAAPDIDPAAAMSQIKAALASEVKEETKKVELKPAPAAEAKQQLPEPEVTDAVFAEGDAKIPETEPEAVPEAEPAAPVPFVRFHGVRKTYDGVALVVKDLNLDIEKGEFLTLLGPSGSGKTTTLLMLAGFETPTEGDIQLEGKSLAELPPHKRGLGFVFQNYALFPHMTVGENLAFPLEVRRKSKTEIRQRVSRALQMVELEGFDKRKPHQLSGGQQQRVAVARALVFDPTLVLMDEPLGALDKHLREQMQYELKRLHRELGVTVVYVTHDQGEALTLSDRIAVFHDGVIQQLDTPAKIYDAPANAFVASFIGENNALAGRVLSIDDNLCTVELAGGTRVKAVRGNVGVPGTTVVVCVRPENLTLSEEAGARGGENQLGAMVDDMVFHGDHVRVKLSSTGGHEIDVKAQARTTTIPAKGVTVMLSWEPYACRAFAAS